MRFLPAAALILGLATSPARADLAEAVEGQILPGTAAFAAAGAALRDQAAADCTPGPELRAAWNGAFDAWLGMRASALRPAGGGRAGQRHRLLA